MALDSLEVPAPTCPWIMGRPWHSNGSATAMSDRLTAPADPTAYSWISHVWGTWKLTPLARLVICCQSFLAWPVSYTHL